MAFEEALRKYSREAGADLSTHQYKVVKLSSGKIVLCGAGELPAGILQDDPASGEAGSVGFEGISKGVAGAAIAQDAEVSSDANGKLRTAVSTDRILGIALEAATADGEVIPVLLKSAGETA